MEGMDVVSISERENSAHAVFFGRTFNLDFFRCFLGQIDPETLCEWLRLGLEPHFLPKVEMGSENAYMAFPGWKKNPGPWFLKAARGGDFSSLALSETFPLDLGGQVVLIDTRCRPMFGQAFEKDNLLGPAIWTMRRRGDLASHPGQRLFSRFGVSAKEWKLVVSALADRLGVEDRQVRLERVIEANVVPQLYPHLPRGRDFKANSYIMVDECLEKEKRQLAVEGGSGVVGNFFVSLDQENHWLSCAVRPIIVLDEV